MGAFAEYLASETPPAAEGAAPVADDSPGQFGTGLRSGFHGLLSQGASFVGSGMEAAGLDPSAANRYAQEEQEQANAAAPRVGSYQDVHDLRSGYDYVSGLLGQSLPQSAVAIAGGLAGRTLPGRIAGATLAQVPFEGGDIAQRQQADPVSMREAPIERFGHQLGGGFLSSAAQSVLPEMVAGKLLNPAKRGVGQALKAGLTELPEAMAIEGGTEALGEAAKQGAVMLSNPDRQLDTHALLEAGIGGAVAGGAMHGIGTAGEVAHAAGHATLQSPGNVLAGARDAVKGLLPSTGQPTTDDAGKGTPVAPLDPVGAIRGIYDPIAKKAKDYLDRVAAGEEFPDASKVAGQAAEKIKAMLPEMDAERVATVKGWANDLAEKGGLDEARRAQLAQASTDLADRGNQMVVAGLKKGADATKWLYKASQDLVDTFGPKVKGAAAAVVDTALNRDRFAGDRAKKSEDFSGIRQAIASELVPALKKVNPDIFDDPKALGTAADGVRMAIDVFRRGGKEAITATETAKLIDIFGNQTVNVLESVHKAMGQASPEESDRFYGALNEIRTQQKGEDKVLGTMMKALRPELQDTVKTTDLRRELQALREWVQHKSVAKGGKQTSLEELAFRGDTLLEDLRSRYGDKAEKILELVEKETHQEENKLDKFKVKTDDEGNPITDTEYDGPNRLTERGAPKDDTVNYGRVTDTGADGLEHIDTLRNPKSQAAQALIRAQKENPTKTVEFLTAAQLGDNHPSVKRHAEMIVNDLKDENPALLGDKDALLAHLRETLKDYGMVVAEGTKQETAISKNDLPKILLKKPDGPTPRSWYNHPSRLEVDGKVFDANKLLTLMKQRQTAQEDFTDADDRSDKHRDARAFMEGVAALQAYLGKAFEVPDATLIRKNLTWGEAKGLNLGRDPYSAQMVKLDERFAELKRMYEGGKVDGASKAFLAKTVQEARDIRNSMIAMEQFEQTETKDGLGVYGTEFSAARAREIKDLRKRVEVLEGKINGSDKGDAREMGRKVIAAMQAKLTEMEKADAASVGGGVRDTAKEERDPFGNVHEAVRGRNEPSAEIRTNLSGNPRGAEEGYKNTKVDEKAGRPFPDDETRAKSGKPKVSDDFLREKFETLQRNAPSAPAKAIATRALALIDNQVVMNGPDRGGLTALLTKGTKLSDVAGTVNALHEKYVGKFEAAKPETKPEAKAAKPAPDTSIDKDFVTETYPDFKTKAEADAYLVRAYKRWGELRAEDARILNDPDHPTNTLPEPLAKAFNALGHLFEDDSHADLSSFYPDTKIGDASSDAAVRRMLHAAAPEVAAQGPKGGKPSLQSAGATKAWTGTDQEIKDVRAYVDNVLGPTIHTSLANIPHAGEFVNDTVRISVHALDPKSVGYHEALHAFFSRLIGQNNSGVARALEAAALAAPVQNQLRTLLKNEPAALAQLRDPEEAAAYMYQFWAAGKLNLGTASKDIFTKIKDAILKVFGIWSQNERAEAIMEYFHSGEFNKTGMGNPNAVAKALLEPGHNHLIDEVRDAGKGFTDLALALTTAGSQRLRATGIPALKELADVMKATGRDQTRDNGFIPAARIERTRVLNDLGAALRGYSHAEMQEALEAMQAGLPATSVNAKAIQAIVQGPKGLLPTMLSYMKTAGVDLKQIMPNPDYFPRQYDAEYISRHQKEFRTVLESNGVGKVDAEAITRRLTATNGAQFTIETDKPGMQHLKERKLWTIPDAELAPYMKKDLFEILGSYVTQATRRAEWARRLGDDGTGIDMLLNRAKAEGATQEQLDAGRKYVRAIDGTLGDTLNPTARRIMGNITVYQNIRLLPLAIFSSIVDPLGIVVRGGTVKDAFATLKRGVQELPRAFKDAYAADADEKLAEAVGTIDSAVLAHSMSQAYTQGMVGDTARRLNDAFFRYNLMEGFNRSMRVGATQAAIKFLERHQDGTASPHSVRWLSELGLQPGFKLDLTDEKVRAAINMWVDGAVLRPDAADKPLWMSDPHFMLISHLKQFAYSFQETILKRIVHEVQAGNYAPVMAIASYVPVMIAADLVKGMIQGGGDLPEWKKAWGAGDYLSAGVQRAGLLGTGQVMVDGPAMALGPTIQQAYDTARAFDGQGSQVKAAVKALPASSLFAGWLGHDDGGAAPAGHKN